MALLPTNKDNKKIGAEDISIKDDINVEFRGTKVHCERKETRSSRSSRTKNSSVITLYKRYSYV